MPHHASHYRKPLLAVLVVTGFITVLAVALSPHVASATHAPGQPSCASPWTTIINPPTGDWFLDPAPWWTSGTWIPDPKTDGTPAVLLSPSSVTLEQGESALVSGTFTYSGGNSDIVINLSQAGSGPGPSVSFVGASEFRLPGGWMDRDDFSFMSTGMFSASINTTGVAPGTYDVSVVIRGTDFCSHVTGFQYAGPVTVVVTASNKPPTAVAKVTAVNDGKGRGGPFPSDSGTVDEGYSVGLSGTGSSDPETPSTSLAYSWSCSPAASLSDNRSNAPSFGPQTVTADTTYTCTLTVKDPEGLSNSDSVTITVKDVPVAVNGQCGATNNVCTKGTLRDDTDNDTQYLWTCLGQNGGSNSPQCTETKPPGPVDGKCAATHNNCTSPLAGINPSETDTLWKWSCPGSGTPVGTTASCSETKPVVGSISLNGVGACNGTTPRINLSWNDIVGTVGYDLERCQTSGCNPAGSVFRQLSSTRAPTQTYTDDSSLATINRYRVRSRAPDVASNVVEVAKPICSVPAVCGNGVVETGEQCDDGNLNNGDGCSSSCMTEGPGPFTMSATTSQCRADGTVDITLLVTHSAAAQSKKLYRHEDINDNGIQDDFFSGGQVEACVNLNPLNFNDEFYVDTGRKSERMHWYWARAYRTRDCDTTFGSTPSNRVTVTTPACTAPSCTLKAKPASIPLGRSSVLEWTSRNAVSGSITNNVNNDAIPMTTVDGETSVSPTNNTTYTATVTASDDSTGQCTADVEVTPPPNPPTATLDIRKLNIDPWGQSVTVNSGEQVELRWGSTDADQCTSTDFPTGLARSGTTAPLTPSADKTYAIACSGPGGSDSDSASVKVVCDITAGVCPPDISADPLVVDYGGTSTVTWNPNGNTGCIVTATNGDTLGLPPPGSVTTSGSHDTVGLYGETEYKITCGSKMDKETIRVRPQFEEI